jgi:hypothetical protein
MATAQSRNRLSQRTQLEFDVLRKHLGVRVAGQAHTNLVGNARVGQVLDEGMLGASETSVN